MGKRSILIVITVLIISLFVSCNNSTTTNNNSEDVTNKEIFNLWIYPSSYYKETYKITLLENNVLQVNMGERLASDVLNPVELINIQIESKKQLENIDYGIMDCVEEIYNDETIKSTDKVYADAWMLKYSYKDKDIIQCCDEITSPTLKELYKFLIELSPIDINMRGFA